jgi:hypothetical protein
MIRFFNIKYFYINNIYSFEKNENSEKKHVDVYFVLHPFFKNRKFFKILNFKKLFLENIKNIVKK